MALIEYHEVDENGNRLGVHVLDSERDEIPKNFFEGWGDRVFYNPKWDFELNDWVESEDKNKVLDIYRKMKDEELSKACQQAILDGFEYIVDGIKYHFSYDTEAQLNFQGVERLFSQGLISEVKWTVKRDGEYERITITKDIMDELSLVMLSHKDSKISRYRDVLTPMVKNAKTVEELNAIHWDMEIPQQQQQEEQD